MNFDDAKVGSDLIEDLIKRADLINIISREDIDYVTQYGVYFKTQENNKIFLSWEV